MTIYPVPEALYESRLQKLQKARRWLVVALVLLLLIAAYLGLHSTGRAASVYRVLAIGSFVVLMDYLWNPFRLRKRSAEIGKAYRIHSLEIDSDGLRINWMTWSKFIPRNEITQVEEPPNGRGLYVRTRRRFSWCIIPRKSERYEEMKAELAAMGIPIVQTSAPFNLGFSLRLPVLCIDTLQHPDPGSADTCCQFRIGLDFGDFMRIPDKPGRRQAPQAPLPNRLVRTCSLLGCFSHLPIRDPMKAPPESLFQPPNP